MKLFYAQLSCSMKLILTSQNQWSLVVRKRSSGFLTRSDTNQAVDLQKMARGLKFWRD